MIFVPPVQLKEAVDMVMEAFTSVAAPGEDQINARISEALLALPQIGCSNPG